jgi:hypothetical protein
MQARRGLNSGDMGAGKAFSCAVRDRSVQAGAVNLREAQDRCEYKDK